MIELKTPQEIDVMRKAGAMVGELLEHLSRRVAPGITTKALDEAAHDFIRERGAQPAFLGYRGYPATICVSVNEEVVHGIPGAREIRAGDVVSIDAGVVVDGLYGDAAVTVVVGAVSADTQRLVDTTREALGAGIAKAAVGNRVSDISHAVEQVIVREGFGIVRDFVGHGIGRAMHEDPPIPNFGPPNTGPRLESGMVLAIEPMVTLGRPEVEISADGWTAITKDRSLAAHFEHTVAITDDGASILTAREHAEQGRH